MKSIKNIMSENGWFNKKLKLDKNSEYMSGGFTMVPNKFLKLKDLTVNEKIVFISLLSFAFKGDECFPSLTTLSKMNKLTKPTLIKCIKTLAEKKMIDVTKENGGNNFYTLNLTNLNKIDELGGYKGGDI